MNNSTLQPVQTLLVATDFSPASEIAVEQAALLAKRWGAELILLHVFNDGFWATIKAIYEAERWMAAEPVLIARNRLSQQARELAEKHGIRVRCDTRTGRAASEIAAFSREQNVRLVVVGEHGEDWIGETIVGGTALKVLQHAELPVLLVRRPASADLSNVLVASDFSDNATRALQLAVAWFPTARVHLLHAYLVAFEGRMRLAGASHDDIERYRQEECARAESRMDRQLATLQARMPVSKLLLRGNPPAMLKEQVLRLEADLLVIGKHGGAAWDERLLGSVTQNVLYHAGCNVLLVP